MTPPLKSSAHHAHTQEILQRFREAGLTVTDWCKANGFRRDTAYKVIHGHYAAHRGDSHRIAVALGLKPATGEVDPRKFKPLKVRS